jgi:hypothetical protein
MPVEQLRHHALDAVRVREARGEVPTGTFTLRGIVVVERGGEGLASSITTSSRPTASTTVT